jgi:hypothetical protein
LGGPSHKKNIKFKGFFKILWGYCPWSDPIFFHCLLSDSSHNLISSDM